MAVAGGTISTGDFFEVRGYQVMFKVGSWSVDTLGHSSDLKTQSTSLGFSEFFFNCYYYFLRHKFLLLMFDSVVRMENPLTGKREKFHILNIHHFCSLLRNGWGVHALLCCQLLFCCICYFTVSSLWWLTETCQLFLISLQAWKSSLEGCV